MTAPGAGRVRSCGTCRHWQRDHDGWGLSLRLAYAEGEAEDDEWEWDSAHSERVRRAEQRYGRCSLIDLLDRYERYEESSLPLAFTRDGSDYKATLYTQAEFACTLHEPVVTTPARNDR